MQRRRNAAAPRPTGTPPGRRWRVCPSACDSTRWSTRWDPAPRAWRAWSGSTPRWQRWRRWRRRSRRAEMQATHSCPEATRLRGAAASHGVSSRNQGRCPWVRPPATIVPPRTQGTYMSALSLQVNGKELSADNVDPNTPLLWVLRDTLGLVGTKFGCGMALCGACTVHVDGAPTRACSTPVSAVIGKSITTIEGLAPSKDKLHPLQQAWIEHDVPQCGYCQSGQLMSAAALLERTPKPTDADIDAAMAGNICRCGTYQRIRAAIHTAAGKLAQAKSR